MESTHHLAPGQAAMQAAKIAVNHANLQALEREITAERRLAGDRGMLAVNVMRAVATTLLRSGAPWSAGSTRSSSAPACRSIFRNAEDHPKALPRVVELLRDAGIEGELRGAGALPIGDEIRSVAELMTTMLTAPQAAL